MANKNYLLIMFFGFIPLTLIGQSSDFEWAKSAGSNSNDHGASCATDFNGNIFVTGSFEAPITFSSITLTNSGVSDAFVVKYDANGNAIWAKDFGGTGCQAGGFCCTVDIDGNIIVTGWFMSSSINFNDSTFLNPTNYHSMFLVKLDSNGNLLWAKGASGIVYDSQHSCTTDNYGNVFVTGTYFSQSITFGTITLYSAIGSTHTDMFIVKYDANGNVIWAKNSGSRKDVLGFGCATDSYGNINIVGYFVADSITFGNTTLYHSPTSPQAFDEDMFVVKYDAAGSVIWANSASGNGINIASYCSTDNSGNLFVTGYFNSSDFIFGIDTIHNNSGQTFKDAFIAKYDINGTFLWAKSIGGNHDDYGLSCVTDSSGNVFTLGRFSSSDFSVDLTVLNNSNAFTYDSYVIKLDPMGNVLWGRVIGGIGYQGIFAAANSYDQSLLIVGDFDASISLGSSIFNSNSPYTDLFIAKLNSNTSLVNIKHSVILTVSPNPLNKMTVITSPKTLANATIVINNLQGQSVYETRHLNGNNIEFHRGNLSSGLYYATLIEDNNIISICKLILAD